MGDGGRFYVDPAEAPIYRSLLPLCHLLLPNQFELETLTGITVTDTESLIKAVGVLHKEHDVPHVFITSTQLSTSKGSNNHAALTLIGSTSTSTRTPRPFIITPHYFPASFVGTGDAFAALMTARLREEATKAGVLNTEGWISSDDVSALELPLAKAAQLVVSSMQGILAKTWEKYDVVSKVEVKGEDEKEKHLRLMKALELRLVGNTNELLNPQNVESFKAKEVQ
jgi:pyridoxine kinase